MSETLLSREELEGLTIWGAAITAQMRDGEMALHIMDDAPRSTEHGHPAILPLKDVRKLKALLDEAEKRGEIDAQRTR